MSGNSPPPGAVLDEVDRRLVVATQSGLPLCPRPYQALAEQLDITSAEVRTRIARMLEAGVIRRIGAVPNHYALGFSANAMSVWDVADERIREAGRAVGALEFVSHCYHRPRRLPAWPYNLFAMLHGRDRAEVDALVERVAAVLDGDCAGHAVLYSTRILKKTGIRIAA